MSEHTENLRRLLAEAIEHLDLLSKGEADDPDTGIFGWNDCHRIVAEARELLAQSSHEIGTLRERVKRGEISDSAAAISLAMSGHAVGQRNGGHATGCDAARGAPCICKLRIPSQVPKQEPTR